MRRGSGGAQTATRVAIPPPTPAQTLSVVDQYAHTKKTRTKPVRNADGILIRKDGRPDMRSQSSAANLRKVHARKEEEKRLEAEAARGGGTGEGSPVTEGSRDSEAREGDGESSTQERTTEILTKMFPHGIDEQKGRLAGKEAYFPKDREEVEMGEGEDEAGKETPPTEEGAMEAAT